LAEKNLPVPEEFIHLTDSLRSTVIVSGQKVAYII